MVIFHSIDNLPGGTHHCSTLKIICAHHGRCLNLPKPHAYDLNQQASHGSFYLRKNYRPGIGLTESTMFQSIKDNRSKPKGIHRNSACSRVTPEDKNLGSGTDDIFMTEAMAIFQGT